MILPTNPNIPAWSLPARASSSQTKRWYHDMVVWISSVLDQRTDANVRHATRSWSRRSVEKCFESWAIEDARRGEIESLRQHYPHIAKFIHLPRTGRRGKYPRRRGQTPTIDFAVEDAAFVKMFWRAVYGRKNRGRDDNMSAEAIVAEYYAGMGCSDVTEDAIKDRAKTYRIPRLVARRDAVLARLLASSSIK
jgi:hypothetical protein